MKYHSIEELRPTVTIHAAEVEPMSPRERLARWAALLGRDPKRVLRTLEGTEHRAGEAQARMRTENSPISVALEDPVLRADGLKDDTYGEAKRFFQLSDRELHEVVCYCHFGGTMTARAAASRVQALAGRGMLPAAAARVWHTLTG